jgi:hypothetical protein
MASLHINDVGRIPMSVMEFEFIDTEILCLPFGFDELFAVNGVFLLKALFVDILDDVLSQPGNLSNLFVRVSLECQEVTGVLIKGFRNQVTRRFEADELFFDSSAATAPKLNMGKSQTTEIIPKAEMPECDVRMTVDMHPLSAFTPAFTFRQVKISLKAVNCSSGRCFPDDGLRIMEAKQTGRNLEKFC